MLFPALRTAPPRASLDLAETAGRGADADRASEIIAIGTRCWASTNVHVAVAVAVAAAVNVQVHGAVFP